MAYKMPIMPNQENMAPQTMRKSERPIAGPDGQTRRTDMREDVIVVFHAAGQSCRSLSV